MTLEDQSLLQKAIHLAREQMQAGAGGPFGAVIAKAGQVIATGWNQVTSTMDPTAHAEIVTIRSAAQKLGHFSLQGCTLYSSCEPCPMCLAAAYWARVDRIVFAASRLEAAAAGFDDALIYQELQLPITERLLPMQQALSAEGAAVLHEWEAKADKVPY